MRNKADEKPTTAPRRYDYKYEWSMISGKKTGDLFLKYDFFSIIQWWTVIHIKKMSMISLQMFANERYKKKIVRQNEYG